MSYWSVGTIDDDLTYFVWADNSAHAKRVAENEYDLALPPQRTVVKSVLADDIPDGDDVIGEPEEQKESRTDGMEI